MGQPVSRAEWARRLAEAQRELSEIADRLMLEHTSKVADRQDFARRLNAVRSSLRTVELEVRR